MIWFGQGPGGQARKEAPAMDEITGRIEREGSIVKWWAVNAGRLDRVASTSAAPTAATWVPSTR